MEKHTPGPWGLVPAPCADIYAITQYSNDVIRVETKNVANARLIAAAPDLLEALLDCRRALEVANFTGELAVVNAAIAKATKSQ